jgi:hypothetical protein
MNKRFTTCMLGFSLLLLLGSETASADATFSSSAVTCSTFSATGTVTTAYVAVRIWNTTDGQVEGGPALIDSYFDVGAPTAYFPAPGGAFSFTVSFPAQNTGDVIVARIYATDTPAFGAWDGGTFPEVQGSCANAVTVPTLSAWMLAMFAVVLGAAGLRFAGRA